METERRGSGRLDRFFSAEQQKRLAELMKAWRMARDSSAAFPAAEQAELELLIDAELEASTQRGLALLEVGHCWVHPNIE